MALPADQTAKKKMPYWFNVLIAIDQLGNAIADGNPDNTISARVGFFASDDHKSRLKLYWKALEWIINFAFEPVQGPGHCHAAWLAEQDETDTQGTYIARVILGIFVAAACVFISIILRLAVLIYPPWRYKPEHPSYAAWRQVHQSAPPRRAAAVGPPRTAT